jgi:hypothetical protein
MLTDGSPGSRDSVIATSEPRLIMEVVRRETDSFPRDAGSPCRGHA